MPELKEYADFEELQRQVCAKCGVEFTPPVPRSTLGFAMATQGKKPVYGIRHLPHKGTNGWYVWCGGNKTNDPDFFQALHTEHLVVKCPEAIAFLALPPGTSRLDAQCEG